MKLKEEEKTSHEITLKKLFKVMGNNFPAVNSILR